MFGAIVDMTLPTNTGQILRAAGYRPSIDYIAQSAAGIISLVWSNSAQQPTDQQINDWGNSITPLPSGLTFAQWLAVNGGDASLTLRYKAKAILSENKSDAAVLRAVILLMLDEFNMHTAKTNAILTAIDNAASLAALKTAVAAITDLPTRTAQQLKTAIQAKIDAGDADT